MIDRSKYQPNTVYVTYIASTPEKVWQALTDPAFTQQYFAGFAIDVEPRAGGKFFLRHPDGRVHMSGEVVEWSPPRCFASLWVVEESAELRELPASLITYEIEQSGGAVKLTMTEASWWDIPDEILAGGRTGWPAILSSLKSVLETGKPLDVKLEPPAGFIEAVKRAVAEKPWLKS
jgi:uncharacterized protein YndB with AHSA1/START domain